MSTDDGPADEESRAGVLDAAIDVDDDEYVRRRRLKAINDARERAAKMPAKTWALVADGKLTEYSRHLMVFSAVDSFLREARPALRDIEGSDAVLQEEPLGVIDLTAEGGDVPDDPDDVDFVGLGAGVGNHEILKNGSRRSLVPLGLRFILDSRGQITSKWQVVDRNHTKADERRKVTARQAVPARVSMNAFDLAVDALDDTDLSISAKTDRDEYDQEYGSLAADDVAAKTNGHR